MFKFDEFFQSEYQFRLKEVIYNVVDDDSATGDEELKYFDTLTAEQVERQLLITFSRNVVFEPKTLFEIRVMFEAVLTFKDEINLDELDIDWVQAIKTEENPYMYNIASRASNIISDMTSSCGQSPLITPPNFTNEG